MTAAGPEPTLRSTRQEHSTHDGLNADDVEEIGRNRGRLDSRRLVAARHGLRADRVTRERGERLCLALQVTEVRLRDVVVRSAVRADVLHADDALEVGIGQRLQQHAVDDAEDHRARPDAER
jgi:hypothetical protein